MKEYKLKTGLLDRPRSLILTKEYIEFENKNLKRDLFTRVAQDDIVDFKHEVDRIIWYQLSVGTKYSLSLLQKNGKAFNIQFKSYFGMQSNYRQIYPEIVTAIWEYYFTDIVQLDLEKIYDNHDIELKGVRVGLNGIEFIDTGERINWVELDYKHYFKYFALHNANNSETHRTFDFNEWNSERLFCLIRTVKDDRGR